MQMPVRIADDILHRSAVHPAALPAKKILFVTVAHPAVTPRRLLQLMYSKKEKYYSLRQNCPYGCIYFQWLLLLVSLYYYFLD